MALWQRTEAETPTSNTTNPVTEAPATAAAPAGRRETRMERLVNIGQSIAIKGELTGNEDLTIDGRVDGKILLKDHNLTIGTNGRITAEVHAKTVVIIGEVIGNITADDKIEVAASGSVQGDLRAPRVVLSDGARFKGAIDMGKSAAQPSVNPGMATATAAAMPRSAAGMSKG